MMDTLFWIAVGVFVGWHVPQPSWAVLIEDWVKSRFRTLLGR